MYFALTWKISPQISPPVTFLHITWQQSFQGICKIRPNGMTRIRIRTKGISTRFSSYDELGNWLGDWLMRTMFSLPCYPSSDQGSNFFFLYNKLDIQDPNLFITVPADDLAPKGNMAMSRRGVDYKLDIFSSKFLFHQCSWIMFDWFDSNSIMRSCHIFHHFVI